MMRSSTVMLDSPASAFGMNVMTHRYDDLEHAIDDVRARLESLASDPCDGCPEGHVFSYTQLVVHEWLANLLQHADFADGDPQAHVRIDVDPHRVSCAIADNSTGFDLDARLCAQRKAARAFPERGMGLRIISACTTQFAYRRTQDGHYCFTFSISADHTPWLSTLF